jgi:glycosyltransferase involved in cell wall biosynthesis
MIINYSIIIPTLDQSTKLRLCLAYLAKLEFDPDAFEVLVIDNGSTDDTKGVTDSQAGTIRNLSYHYCAEPGLMAARHMGCDEAKGDILCYLDDDSLVNKEWLQGMAESFSRDDVIIAGGPCIPKYEAPPPDWVDYFWYETGYGKTNGFLSLVDFGKEFKMIPPVYIYGCNYSIRKSVFLENSGTLPDYYPKGMSQYIGDGESGLSFKLQQKGFLAAYNPKARIDHLIPSSRLTLDYFCWRRYYNGIHDSYHYVRRQHGLEGYQALDSISFPLSHVIVQAIRRPLGRVKRYVFSLLQTISCLPTTAPPELREIVDMKKKIEESFRAGYAFHQKSLKKDPHLLEWVLRPDYLGKNGKLPKSQYQS